MESKLPNAYIILNKVLVAHNDVLSDCDFDLCIEAIKYAMQITRDATIYHCAVHATMKIKYRSGDTGSPQGGGNQIADGYWVDRDSILNLKQSPELEVK